MISKYLILITILTLSQKTSSFKQNKQSLADQRSLVDQQSTADQNVYRIHLKNDQETTNSSLLSNFDRLTSYRTIDATGANIQKSFNLSDIQNISKVQVLESNAFKKLPKIPSNYCPANCTCLSLIGFKSRHNDSELILSNHCLYLNLSDTNKEQFKLYEHFHPFQLHQMNELILNYNIITNLNENLLLNTGHHQTIEKLSLSHNRLYKFPKLNGLTNSLKYLNLDHNLIVHLTGNKSAYQSLVSLNLNHNRIKSVRRTFLKQICNQVKCIDLSSNRLTRLDDRLFIHCEQLQLLKLNKNRLKSIGVNAFDNLTNLVELDLSQNNLTYLTVEFKPLMNLKLLNLNRNNLQSINRSTFQHLVNLQTLNLNENNLQHLDAYSFGELTELRWLFLNDNYLNKQVAMNQTLLAHNRLTHIALENNHLTYIPNQLFVNLTSLVTIDLSLNQLKYIEENALQSLVKLDEFNFDSTELECNCRMKWFVNFYQERSIENIYLEHLECRTPARLAGKPFIDVNINFFLCEDDFKHYFLKEPKRQQTINQGQQFELRCKVVTNSFINEDIVFEWRKNNRTFLLNNEPNVFEIMKLKKDKDHTLNHKLIYSSYLHFLNASNKDAGHYQCLAKNSYGSIQSQTAQVMISKPPEFETFDNHLKVQLGDFIEIDCKTINDDLLPEISLNKNGQNFTSSIKHRIQFDRYKQQFTIKNATLDDQGLFTCIAINKLGKATKNITVDILYAPYFETAVQANESEYFDEGDTILINCSAKSNPIAKVILYKDKQVLETDLNDRYYLKSNSQILIIKNSRPSDSGLYRCILKNELGILKLIRKVEILTSDQAKLNYLYNNWYLVFLFVVIFVCSICLIKIICVFILKPAFHHMFRSDQKISKSNRTIEVMNNGQIDENQLNPQKTTLLSRQREFSSKYLSRNSLKEDCVTKLISYKKVACSLEDLSKFNSNHLIKMPVVKKVQFKLDN